MSKEDRLSWSQVCPLADVPVGTVRPVKAAGLRLAVCNRAGALYLVDNTCPHRGGPLARGKLVRGELTCPWHAFRFDPATGEATMPADLDPAVTYPVRVEAGEVQIGLETDDTLEADETEVAT